MSDEHDDDGLSELFGPPGKTGQHPQEPAPEQPEPQQPATPSWELPTTAMPQQDAPPPAAEPAPSEPAPDPLAWLLAGQQAAPTPVAEPPAPTTAFAPPTAPHGEQPPASTAPSSADPFGVVAAAAGLGVGAAPEDFATRRFEPTPPAGDGDGPEDPGSNRRTLLILGIVGGVLLIAIIVLGIVLLTRGSDPTPTHSASHSQSPSASETPSASPTPSETPSATPTPTPTPTPTQTVAPPPLPTVSAKATPPDCTDPTKTDAPFQINYSSSNATVVKLANGGTVVAQEAPPAAFPGLQYDCTAAAPSYTVTATGPGGSSQPVAVPVTPATKP